MHNYGPKSCKFDSCKVWDRQQTRSFPHIDFPSPCFHWPRRLCDTFHIQKRASSHFFCIGYSHIRVSERTHKGICRTSPAWHMLSIKGARFPWLALKPLTVHGLFLCICPYLFGKVSTFQTNGVESSLLPFLGPSYCSLCILECIWGTTLSGRCMQKGF